MPLKRGDAIRWQGTGSDTNPEKPHIFVCIDVLKDGAGDQYIVVPICSDHDKADPACKIAATEYVELTHASYAAYYLAKVTTDKILNVNAHAIKPAKQVKPVLWAKMRKGLRASEETRPIVTRTFAAVLDAEAAAKAAKAQAIAKD